MTSEDHKVINVTHDYDFSASSRLADEIFPKLKPCVDEYLQAFDVLGQRKFLLYDLKLKEIPAGGGFHAWHYENGALDVAARQFVVQIYLNDDFDGGETEFLYQKCRFKPEKNTMLVWPSQFTHIHRGNPPLSNDKYIITGWVEYGY